MRYSDRQRVQKIYEYAIRLQKYIVENHIDKEALLNELPILTKQLDACLREDENTNIIR